MRVFISHSSNNADSAEKLCKKLEEKGFPCFIAPRDIRSGYEYAEEIVNGLDCSDIIVLLLSEASNSSPHVLREIERAVSKNKPIIVYKLEEVALCKSLEYFLMTHQWVNAKPGKDFDEVVRRVSEYTEPHDNAWQSKAQVIHTTEKTGRYKLTFAVIAAVIILIGAAAVLTSVLVNNSRQKEIIGTSDIPESSAAAQPSYSESQAQSESTSSASSSIESAVVSSEASETSDITESEPQHSEPKPAAASAKPGDRITLGTYNNEPIEWRVIHVSDDKTKAVVISDKIITMKAFDAAEGGTFNKKDGVDYWRTRTSEIDDPEIQRQIRGDNRWELSNIRTWLNSDRENVKYTGQAPASSAMSEKKNGYHTEPGFLNSFTDKELSAIAVSEIKTAGSVTEDRVFLLSAEELKWLEEADVSIYAKPTEAAIKQDKSLWYSVNGDAYDCDDLFWWLREPNSETACECLCVNMSCFQEATKSEYVGLEGYGIRPAMTLDLTSDILEN